MRFIFLSILLLQGCSSGVLSLSGGRKMISCSSSDSSKTIEEVWASSVSIEDAILNTGAELKLLIKKQGLKKLLDLEAES